MSNTFDDINEVKSFDVIFIGHLASVTAYLFATETKNAYKSLVLKTQKSVIETSLLPTCTDEITVIKRPKNPSIHHKQSNIINLKPISKQVELQGGKIYDYKYLVYTGNVQDWTAYDSIQTLKQALSNDYSLVYSNITKRNVTTKHQSGNIVFYIPDGRHSGYDNFNFLFLFHKISQQENKENSRPLKFIIVLEGKEFFPYCKEADKLLMREVQERGIEVFINSKLTKVDYLRRTLTINDSHEVPYNLLYCVVPQRTPIALQSAGIDPYTNNAKTLQNKKFKNVFIFGADIFPTTHTFESIQYQNHIITRNLHHLLSHSGEICLYNGTTQIPLYINSSEVINITHDYGKGSTTTMQKEKKSLVMEKCSWMAYYMNKMTKFYLAECYYNYRSSGSPYYVFSPQLESVKLLAEGKGQHTEPVVAGHGKMLKMEEDVSENIDAEDKVNQTEELPRHLAR